MSFADFYFVRRTKIAKRYAFLRDATWPKVWKRKHVWESTKSKRRNITYQGRNFLRHYRHLLVARHTQSPELLLVESALARTTSSSFSSGRVSFAVC